VNKKRNKIMTKTLKALSDSTRLAIVEMVCKSKFKTPVKKMIKKLEIEPTLLSHHLRILKDLNIVRSERRGKEVRYWMGDKTESSSNDSFAVQSGMGHITVQLS